MQIAAFGNHSPNANVQISGILNGGEKNYLQFAGLFNYGSCTAECTDNIQISPLANYSYIGFFQFGTVNVAGETEIQSGGINLSNKIKGYQIGLLNRSLETEGAMFGLINESHELTGYQIGLINIAKNGKYPIMPFYNSNYEKRDVRKGSGFIEAKWTLFQLALYSPAQVFKKETAVKGLRVNILFGKNDSVSGLDIGLFSRSEKVRGIAISGVNISEESFMGIQTGLYNQTEDSTGFQIGLGQFNSLSFTGLSVGGVAFTDGDVQGMQIGVLGNIAENSLFPQFSLGFSKAKEVPFQIGGLGNMAEKPPLGQISAGGNYSKQNTAVQIGGLFNLSEANVKLGQVGGIFNRAKFAPFQVSAFGNHVTDEAYFQLAGAFNICMEMQGIQTGAVNFSEKISGMQIGAANFSEKNSGVSFGLWNMHRRQKGISVGVFNYSKKLYGIQIGLLNLNGEGSVPLTLGINAGMNSDAGQ